MDYETLMDCSDHAAKQMKKCKLHSPHWRAWCKTSLQLAEEAEILDGTTSRFWSKPR